MTVDGMSDPEYEQMCYDYRYLFNISDLGIGTQMQMPDRFVQKPVPRSQIYEVPFYVPKLEHLYKLLAERVRLCQEADVPAKNIRLIFDPESGKWLLVVQLENQYTFYGLGNSPHAAYLECIHEMSPFVVTEVDAGKRAQIFRRRRQLPEWPSKEDYVRRREERKKARQQAEKNRFYIYCDENGVLKSTVDGDPANAIDFEAGSLGIARSLVKTRTEKIEPNTVYGPFEQETWTIPKDGLYGMY